MADEKSPPRPHPHHQRHLVVESGWKPQTAVARIVGGLRDTLLKPS